MAGFASAGIVSLSGADVVVPSEAVAILTTTPTSRLS